MGLPRKKNCKICANMRNPEKKIRYMRKICAAHIPLAITYFFKSFQGPEAEGNQKNAKKKGG
jgi:hypothetical protein